MADKTEKRNERRYDCSADFEWGIFQQGKPLRLPNAELQPERRLFCLFLAVFSYKREDVRQPQEIRDQQHEEHQ